MPDAGASEAAFAAEFLATEEGAAAALEAGFVSAGGAAAAGSTIFGISTATLMQVGASFALSTLSGVLFRPNVPNFAAQAQNRAEVIRSAVATRRWVYGTVLVSGPMVMAATGVGPGTSPAAVDIATTLLQAGAVGDSIIYVTGLISEQPLGTLDLTITSGTTFTITGDAQTYTVQADTTAVTDDSVNAVAAVSISPTLQVAAAAGTANTLTYTLTPGATAGMSNDDLYLVIPLADHQSDSVQTIYFGSLPSSDSSFPPADYSIVSHLGTPHQAVDSMINAVYPTDWDSTHVGGGQTYLAAKFHFDPNVWTTGITQLAAVLKGKLLYDPRDAGVDIATSSSGTPGVFVTTGAHGLSVGARVYVKGHTGSDPAVDGYYSIGTTPAANQFTLERYDAGIDLTTGGTGGTVTTCAWSNNWALCVRDYLADVDGLGCFSWEIDDAGTFTTAANVADEDVSLSAIDLVSSSVANPTELTCLTYIPNFATGDTVTIAGHSGSTPDINGSHVATITGPNTFTIPVNVTVAGTGGTVDKSGGGTQKRYTVDGTVDTGQPPEQILTDLLSAGAGMLVYSQGVYMLYAGSYRTPTAGALTESDLRDSIKVRPDAPLREMYNGVSGVFCDPSKMWQGTSFPPVLNASYAADDGGQVLQNIQLPFTTDVIRAQRIAKIHLEKSRQGMTIDFPAKLTAFATQVGDNRYISIAALGWDTLNGGLGKLFTCTHWTMASEGGVDLVFQEEASSCYSWNAGMATLYDFAPNTNLPDPFATAAPSSLLLYQILVRGPDGAYSSKVVCTFNPVLDARVSDYVVEFSVGSTGVWTFGAQSRQRRYEFANLTPATYSIRVKAVTWVGASSAWTTATISVMTIDELLTAGSASLPAPDSMTIWTSTDSDGRATGIEVELTYNEAITSAPNDMLIMWAHFPSSAPNSLDIVSGGTGTTLTIGSAHIIAASNVPPNTTETILAGSTRSRIVLRTADHPFDTSVDNAAMFWAQYDSSAWRRCTSFDATGLVFDPPFDADPVTAHALNWAQISWDDRRSDPSSRLGVILDGSGGYEIIQWGTALESGGSFQLSGCSRGREGTAPISADGKTFYFCPAPAAGSESIVFPASALTQSATSPGVWSGSMSHVIDIPSGDIVYFVACTGLRTTDGWLRSRLILPTWGGPR